MKMFTVSETLLGVSYDNDHYMQGPIERAIYSVQDLIEEEQKTPSRIRIDIVLEYDDDK